MTTPASPEAAASASSMPLANVRPTTDAVALTDVALDRHMRARLAPPRATDGTTPAAGQASAERHRHDMFPSRSDAWMSVVMPGERYDDVEADRMQAATSKVMAERMAQVRERLRRRAWVFDDPRSYTTGVEEALHALVEMELSSPHRATVPASAVVSSELDSHTA